MPYLSADHTGEESAWGTAFRDEPAGAQMLSEQREKLQALRALDEKIVALTRQKSELEVECIAADAALGGAPAKPALDFDRQRAEDLALAFHNKKQIEAALNALEQRLSRRAGTPTRELEQLKAGRDALVSWSDALRAERPHLAFKLTYAAVMAATMIVIWSAIVIHPILLLLLLGLGAVLVFLRSSEQNTTWLQLGAKRHFEETGLKPPAQWEGTAVRARLAELESQLKETITPDIALTESTDEAQKNEAQQLFSELAVATEHLDGMLRTAGLDLSSIDPDLEQWLERLAAGRHARQNLDQIEVKLKTISTEKNAVQESLFRFLSRQGEAPRGGSADPVSLSAGLDRVAARLTN